MNFDIFAKKCRALIPDGITLLEHDGALPFYEGEKVAVFGRGQYEYLKSGSGSGGSVKCAYVDGTRLDANGVKALAAMPSKEQLIAKMLGSLQAPISKFVGVLSAIPRSLVIALNAIAEQKAQ